MDKIVNVKFQPQFGYKAGRLYGYLWDKDVSPGQSAVVKTPDGQLQLVKVISVEDYKPMPYDMKWLVCVVDETEYNQRK